MEALMNTLARVAGVVAYVSVVVFPTLLLLFVLSLDLLPTDLPTFLGFLVFAAVGGLGFFLASLIEIRPAQPERKSELAK